MTRPRETSRLKINEIDICLCAFFIVFWILPLIYTNFTKQKITVFPRFLAGLSSTSNLFTQANYIWPMPYIQVKVEGSRIWITVAEEDYFQMPTFGYRTRLFEALYLASGDEIKQLGVQNELAHWIAKRYGELHLNTKVTAVRFVAGLHRNNPDAIPQGHWRAPSFRSFDRANTYVISEHTIGNH